MIFGCPFMSLLRKYVEMLQTCDIILCLYIGILLYYYDRLLKIRYLYLKIINIEV